MTVQIAVHPLSWTNNVIPEFGGNTPVETYFADAVTAGYAGVELGINVPVDPDVLRPLLEQHGLTLVSGWYSGFLADRSSAEELHAVDAHAKLLQAMGSKVLIYGECGGMAANGSLDIPMSHRILFTDIAIPDYVAKITTFATNIKDKYDLDFAYHHHLMMLVEQPDELAKFMELTGPAVGLLYDTGHYAAGGGTDISKPLEQYGSRIKHIHLKDVRASVMAAVRAQDASFNQGVRNGMFTVPGDGSLDFSPVAKFVQAGSYDGWLSVEAEQDPSQHPPLPTVTRARQHIREVFGL